MSLYLFHIEVFMPQAYKKPIHQGRLKYGNHAVLESLFDRYGEIELPTHFDPSKAKLIETEVDVQVNQITKQVWRQPLDKDRDIVLVIGKGGFVRTVWVNLKSDKHKTLNRSRYVKA